MSAGYGFPVTVVNAADIPIGTLDIDQTTPGTTNGVVVNSSALPTGGATSALQTSIGSTAHTDAGAIATALGGILAVQASYLYVHETGAGTHLVKSGAGVLRGVTVNTKGTVASTISIYDGLTAGGTLLAVIDSLNLSGQFRYDIAFATGLTIVSTDTAGLDYTVSYR